MINCIILVDIHDCEHACVHCSVCRFPNRCHQSKINITPCLIFERAACGPLCCLHAAIKKTFEIVLSSRISNQVPTKEFFQVYSSFLPHRSM